MGRVNVAARATGVAKAALHAAGVIDTGARADLEAGMTKLFASEAAKPMPGQFQRRCVSRTRSGAAT
jgi:hypothetical protein